MGSRHSNDLVRWHDSSRQAWIDNVDFGADGSPDLRTTEISTGQVKQELRIGDRWLEFVRRDGKTGVLLDGQIMSADEARKQLGVSEAAPRQ